MPDPVLRATLDVPFECAFTQAGAMNGLPTYDVPPIPTLQGLLYNATGRPSLLQPNDLDKEIRNAEEEFRSRVQEECSFGIRVVESGEKLNSLRKRHKATEADTERTFIGYPTDMETLLAPTYRIYIGGPESLLTQFEASLKDPARPLYLGRSDDLVDIYDIDIATAEYIQGGTSLDCVVPGTGNQPNLLPVAPDYRGRYTTHPGRVATVSVTGGNVEAYYETTDDRQERFVYVT